MGPLLVTGAACFGAAVGIGLVTGAAGRAFGQTAEPAAVRGLYIVLAAFIEGIGVLGVVIGVQAIFVSDVGDSSAAIVAAVPAVGGAVAGIILAGRSALSWRSPVFVGTRFIAGLGVLGVVIGVLAVEMGGGRTIEGGDGPFVIIALVMLAAAIGHGLSGARSLDALGEARSGGPSGIGTPGTVEFVRMQAIRRAAFFELAAVLAVVVAVLLIVMDGRNRP
jgi:F0F1-type ATP synthase membrane subunit c/vacuolar-type H+-ATPase subunit K